MSGFWILDFGLSTIVHVTPIGDLIDVVRVHTPNPKSQIENPIVNEQQFKQRTKAAALRVIRLVESLPNTRTADVLGKQLLRSATSVGANNPY